MILKVTGGLFVAMRVDGQRGTVRHFFWCECLTLKSCTCSTGAIGMQVWLHAWLRVRHEALRQLWDIGNLIDTHGCKCKHIGVLPVAGDNVLP